MIDNIHLVFFQKTMGPGKVIGNLRRGLVRMGIRELPVDEAENIACLQWDNLEPDAEKFYSLDDFSGKRVLVGPNIWIEPTERPPLHRFSDFVAPSEWVKNYQESYECMKDKNIHVWSVGIDTNTWSPDYTKEKDFDAFMYFKNRDEQDLIDTCGLLVEENLAGHVLAYGGYPEDHLLEFCHRSKFAILLTGTESQGIAYMQMLSTNLPLLVLNKSTWEAPNGKLFPASSVPYFDERCGMIVEELTLDVLREFSENVSAGAYSPRDYILENHTVELAAKRYLDILEGVGIQ